MYNSFLKDKFDIVEVMKENFGDQTSFLANEIFYNNLDESQKVSISDRASSKILGGCSKQMETLNRKKFYGDIPKTKGLFIKSQLYKPVSGTLSILDNITSQGKGMNVVEARECYQTCKFALDNIIANKEYWERGFRNNDTKVVLYYQNMAALTVVATSFLFANIVTVDPNTCQFSYNDNRKRGYLTKNRVIKELGKFNDVCRNRKLPEIRKFNEYIEELDENMYLLEDSFPYADSLLGPQNNNPHVFSNYGDLEPTANSANNPSFKDYISTFKEKNPNISRGIALVSGIAAVTGLIALLIYASRFCIMFFFYKKNSIAQDLDYLSAAVEGNAIANEYDPTKSGEVAARQRNLAGKIKKLGNALDDDFHQAEFNATQKIVAHDKEVSKSIEKEIKDHNPPTHELFQTGSEKETSTAAGDINRKDDDDLFI